MSELEETTEEIVNQQLRITTAQFGKSIDLDYRGLVELCEKRGEYPKPYFQAYLDKIGEYIQSRK